MRVGGWHLGVDPKISCILHTIFISSPAYALVGFCLFDWLVFGLFGFFFKREVLFKFILTRPVPVWALFRSVCFPRYPSFAG